jgi:hypothetical protein
VQKPYREREQSIRVVSLYDLMFEYAISDLAQMVAGILTTSNMLKFAKDQSSPVGPERLSSVSGVLFALYGLGKEIDLDSSLLAQIAELHHDTSREDCRIAAIALKVRLDYIIDGIHDNLKSRKFMFIPADQAVYWRGATIVGENFIAEFSLAAMEEVREAGNCFAAGRWTACVFHCMRVAEHGLRKLAKKVHVTLTHKGKNYPLEYADWEAVITAIKNKIAKTRQIPRGPKKVEELRFYSSAADHCEYMKDIWRNEISHTRRQYSKPESLAVINRVREFIESLSKP